MLNNLFMLKQNFKRKLSELEENWQNKIRNRQTADNFFFPRRGRDLKILSGTAGRSGVKEEGRKKNPEIQATWFADLRNLNVT